MILQTIQWAGHMQHMDEKGTLKMTLEDNIIGERPVGEPLRSWVNR
jgi:hypothetical protein